MSAADTLINNNLGKPLDTDGFPPSQPDQCYDVFIEYIRILSGNPNLYFSATQTGYAQDIYNQYDSNALLQQYFTKLPFSANGQRGDVAVWGKSTQTPDSHVAILEADNGTSQRIFGQNQPYPYCTERDLTSTGLLGYLRPKTTSLPQGGDDMIDQNTLNILYATLLGRAPDPDAITHYVGNYTTSFVVNDLSSSAEHAQYMTNLTNTQNSQTSDIQTLQQQVADLTNQLNTGADTIAQLHKTTDALNQQLANQLVAEPQSDTPTEPPFCAAAPVKLPSWVSILGGNIIYFFKTIILGIK